MQTNSFYAIGTPGIAWGDHERALWLARQTKLRSYADDVVSVIDSLATRFAVVPYGALRYGNDHYQQLALKSLQWNHQLLTVLVTGGVHGYETSGVHGALAFLQQRAEQYAGRVNLLVVPCVSPWAYERINRWNAETVDPNRSFLQPSPAQEAAALMQLVAAMTQDTFVLHIDLHETTDSDESEFRPALSARDGKPFETETIPDGFYLVGETTNPQLEFQRTIIDAVAAVTHIAPADANGRIIGVSTAAPGVVLLSCKSRGLCAGMTAARYTTTTEVYPDSPRTTPAICNAAQVVAVSAAIDFVLR